MTNASGKIQMNICYISSIDISLPNGPGVNEREFVNILQNECRKRGDNLHCILPMPSKAVDINVTDASFYKNEAAGKALTHFRLTVNSIKLIRAFIRLLPFRAQPLFVLRLSPETLMMSLLLRLLKKNYYIKTLEDIYGFASKGPHRPLTRFNFLVKRNLLCLGLSKAVSIDACTYQLVNTYQKRFGLRNIIHIDNTVNIERFDIQDKAESRKRCGLQSFKKIVGYCGGFPSQRGAAQLIQIAQRLVKAEPGCGILIVGDDTELGKLKHEVRKKKLGKWVVFKGLIPYETLADYINCLDAGIALDTSEKVENVGNSSQKIRQYLACGVPVICPENTHQDLVDQDLCISVPVHDLDAIFRAVTHFFKLSVSDSQAYQARARQYAVQVLSTQHAYEKRYQIWKKVFSQDLS